MVFNPSNKRVVGCYADADFAGLWGHENPQYHICDRIRTGFVEKNSDCPLSWVSKLQRDIAISTLYSIVQDSDLK